ncbi:MAG: UDP-N-acetylglucosamine 2-epimerase (non-hydrolyzing) [Bacteroidales bacterium]|nr:UDP-N-acetylglucosamine 2-epimerase (non-hydrolyzing) [Bacteroidales bacterium]
MKILSVVGARPNFMKIAPLIRAVKEYNSLSKDEIEHILVHTGQHYDDRMSKAFFKELEIPEADINLGVGSGTHAEQVGNTMMAFEKVIRKEKPDWVVVVGDVNAILACSVTAKKEHIRCCHIEAGLRSGDMTMPEEINRLVADRLCDLLLTPDVISVENLRKEGVPDDRMEFVGNIMIDTLDASHNKAKSLKISDIITKNQLQNYPLSKLNSESPFAVLTLHRPSNVDRREVLEPLVMFITEEVSADMPVLWTIHPRTRKMLESFGLFDPLLRHENLVLLEPLGYLEMLKLNMHARILLTDSGGLQEECTVLGTPCLTLRWNTERPVTLKEYGGASVLVGNNIQRIREEYAIALGQPRTPHRPPLWDGHTAERCLNAILNYQNPDTLYP